MANFVLLVFLALRNTPLAPLSGQSYEKLRPLHKVAGYTCIVSSVIHGILYLKEGAETGYLMLMRGREDLTGALAGLLMVTIGLSTFSWFARRYYEGEPLRSCTTGVIADSESLCSILHYPCHLVHGHCDSRRNAPTRSRDIHAGYHYIYSLHVVIRSILTGFEVFVELLRQQCHSYPDARWGCPSQASTRYKL